MAKLSAISSSLAFGAAVAVFLIAMPMAAFSGGHTAKEVRVSQLNTELAVLQAQLGVASLTDVQIRKIKESIRIITARLYSIKIIDDHGHDYHDDTVSHS